MRKCALPVLELIGTLAGGCSSVDGNPHAGDSNYAWNYTPVPAVPTMDSVVAGDRRITVYFTPSNAQYFIAVCSIPPGGSGSRNGNTYKSPALVDSLINDIEYRCAVTAFNSGRPSASSSALNATPKAP